MGHKVKGYFQLTYKKIIEEIKNEKQINLQFICMWKMTSKLLYILLLKVIVKLTIIIENEENFTSNLENNNNEE